MFDDMPLYVQLGLGLYAVLVSIIAYAMYKSTGQQKNAQEQAESDAEQVEFLTRD